MLRKIALSKKVLSLSLLFITLSCASLALSADVVETFNGVAHTDIELQALNNENPQVSPASGFTWGGYYDPTATNSGNGNARGLRFQATGDGAFQFRDRTAPGEYAYTIFAATPVTQLDRVDYSPITPGTAAATGYRTLLRRQSDGVWVIGPVRSYSHSVTNTDDLSGTWEEVLLASNTNLNAQAGNDEAPLALSGATGTFATLVPTGSIDGGGIYMVDAADGALIINEIQWIEFVAAPIATLNPAGPVAQVGFGEVISQTITIGNVGANPLIVTNVAVADGGSGAYSLDPSSPTNFTLANGATTDVLVLFDSGVLAPGGSGTADLNVTSNNGGTGGTIDTVAFSGSRPPVYEWASAIGDWVTSTTGWNPGGPPPRDSTILISGGEVTKSTGNVVIETNPTNVDPDKYFHRFEMTGGVFNQSSVFVIAKDLEGQVDMSGGTMNVGGLKVSNILVSSGTLNISGGTINTLNPVPFGGRSVLVGTDNNSQGIINMTGGNINSANDFALAQSAGTTGVVIISGGTIETTDTLIVGRLGSGELNISGTGRVIANALNSGRGLEMGTGGVAFGTINLDGGELILNGSVHARGIRHEFNWTDGLLAVNGAMSLNETDTAATVNFIHPTSGVLSPGHDGLGTIAFGGDSPSTNNQLHSEYKCCIGTTGI